MIWTNPLNWPVGFERTTSPKSGYQFKVSLDKAERELGRELELMGVEEAYISSDNPVAMNGRPKLTSGEATPAVLHFAYKGQQVAIPCDAFDQLKANVRALGLTIESMRRMERYGTSTIMDRAISGFAQLPAGATAPKPRRKWWEVLHVNQDAPLAFVEAAYKVALKEAHPDTGGSVEAFHEVQEAYREATSGHS